MGLFDEMADMMKAIVDTDRCEGNAMCMATAPELFELDDDDQSHVRLDEVPPSMEAAARRAAELCPRMAITLEE